MTYIVGIMWNKNESDILEETLLAALPHVDALYVADDGSTDHSWGIIDSYRSKLAYCVNTPVDDKRQHLLNKVKQDFPYKDTLIQIFESDIMILDTDIKTVWDQYSSQDVALHWHLLNGARKDWSDVDRWPNWDQSITKIMHMAHWMEIMTYTFRPLPGIKFQERDGRPWPRGFAQYSVKENRKFWPTAPLLAHYGYRGPTHFMHKYKHYGKYHKKYHNWQLDSVEAIVRTVPFFNGAWNDNLDTFKLSRDGWIQWLQTRKPEQRKSVFIPNYNTIADIVDRLIVTVNKLAYYENAKRIESVKTTPDDSLIVHWDRLSRNECEYRNMLKMELNNVISDIVTQGYYETLPDYRTFVPPPKTVADLLEEQIIEIGTATRSKLNNE